RVSKLVCWKLDRIGRNARELLTLCQELQDRKVDFVCVAGGIMGLDTPQGRLMFGMLAMFAEFDNEQRSERVRSGQAVAKASGKKWGGSKPGVLKKVKPTQIEMIAAMLDKGTSISAIARALHLSRTTIYYVKTTFLRR